MKPQAKKNENHSLPENPTVAVDNGTDNLLAAAGIAHDLNNVLTTISGYAEMIREDLPQGSPAGIKAGKILAGVSKAKLLTGEIMALGRYIEQDEKVSDVQKILEDTIDFLKPVMPQSIFIEVDKLSDLQLVQAEPFKLFRIFLNLITNAAGSMEEKGGKLIIKMHYMKTVKLENMFYNIFENNGSVAVIFTDTGTGIDPGVIERIFDPYYTTSARGTGLGLMVVKKLIADIKGGIRVESKVDEGSEFTVYLPAVPGLTR
jgi:signal transduction histidine kinase